MMEPLFTNAWKLEEIKQRCKLLLGKTRVGGATHGFWGKLKEGAFTGIAHPVLQVSSNPAAIPQVVVAIQTGFQPGPFLSLAGRTEGSSFAPLLGFGTKSR